jgi:hypothetical protein
MRPVARTDIAGFNASPLPMVPRFYGSKVPGFEEPRPRELEQSNLRTLEPRALELRTLELRTLEL